MSDLWPPFTSEQPESPLTILREQSDALGKKTSGLLQGRVESHTTMRNDNLPWYSHSFFVMAPVLNYEYRLLRVGHGVKPFEDTLVECPLYRDIGIHTTGREQFIRQIEEILNDAKVRTVVDSLYLQAQAGAKS